MADGARLLAIRVCIPDGYREQVVFSLPPQFPGILLGFGDVLETRLSGPKPVINGPPQRGVVAGQLETFAEVDRDEEHVRLQDNGAGDVENHVHRPTETSPSRRDST